MRCSSAVKQAGGILARRRNGWGWSGRINPSTTIPYPLAAAGQVELAIYNMLGQQIHALVGKTQASRDPIRSSGMAAMRRVGRWLEVSTSISAVGYGISSPFSQCP